MGPRYTLFSESSWNPLKFVSLYAADCFPHNPVAWRQILLSVIGLPLDTSFILYILSEYEIFAYLAFLTNILGTFQSSTRKMLDFYIATGVFFILNIYIVKLDEVVLYVTLIGFSISVISRILIDQLELKKKLILMSPLVMIIVIYFKGMNFIGMLTAVGFLFATVAKLQNSLLFMRIFFMLSAIVWLVLMAILGSYPLVFFYASHISLLSYQIIKDRNSDS